MHNLCSFLSSLYFPWRQFCLSFPSFFFFHSITCQCSVRITTAIYQNIFFCNQRTIFWTWQSISLLLTLTRHCNNNNNNNTTKSDYYICAAATEAAIVAQQKSRPVSSCKFPRLPWAVNDWHERRGRVHANSGSRDGRAQWLSGNTSLGLQSGQINVNKFCTNWETVVQCPGPNLISFRVLAVKELIESPGHMPVKWKNTAMWGFLLFTDRSLGIQEIRWFWCILMYLPHSSRLCNALKRW